MADIERAVTRLELAGPSHDHNGMITMAIAAGNLTNIAAGRGRLDLAEAASAVHSEQLAVLAHSPLHATWWLAWREGVV